MFFSALFFRLEGVFIPPKLEGSRLLLVSLSVS